MTDIILRQDGQLPIATQIRYKDMGDGTYAQVVAAGLSAGTDTIGKVDIEATGSILRAVIRCNANGNNTIIAAVAGKQIKVLSVLLIAAGDVNVRFESGAGGTALTGQMSLAADGNGFVLPPALPGYHWMETAAGELLNLELSAAVFVDGLIVYYEE